MRPEPLRVAFVPGVTPDKWARIWAERMPQVALELLPVSEGDQEAVLYDGRAGLSFVRLPADHERLHVIPLYEEEPVVVAARGHFIEAAEEVRVADLADEHLLQDPEDVPEWREVSTQLRDGTLTDVPPLTWSQAFETVGAGGGILIVPLSVARLHQRKDVVHRRVVDVATTRIGLAWLRKGASAEPDLRVEAFIGIVRGRRATSSRGTPTAPTPAPTSPPKTPGGQPEKSRRQVPARRSAPRGRGAAGRSRRGRRR